MIVPYKSPQVLALPDGLGLRLLARDTGDTLVLDPDLAARWARWEWTGAEPPPPPFSAAAPAPPPAGAQAGDDCSPRPAGRHVKWSAESPDLHVLFDTRRHAHDNPLLVLGPYGSLVWRGLLEGRAVGAVRREALRVFGCDEVTPFVARLAALGFVEGWSGEPGPAGTVVKEFPAPEVQFQLVQSAIPWYCLWELSTTCDLRCAICYLPHFTDRGPDRARALALADELVAAGIFYVCLLGGEPLLRPDLEAIVERLRDGGVYTKVITNGRTLSAARARALDRAGLNQVEVSFDGLTAATHEASRGPGTFAAAVAAVRQAAEAGIPRLGVVWTVHDGNLHELAELPAFLRRLEVRECYLSPFKKTGVQGARAPFTPPDPTALAEVRERIADWRRDAPELTVVLLPGCSCGRTSAVIGADGALRLCSFSSHAVGNLHRRPLLDLWRGLAPAAGGPLGYCAPRAAPPTVVSGRSALPVSPCT